MVATDEQCPDEAEHRSGDHHRGELGEDGPPRRGRPERSDDGAVTVLACHGDGAEQRGAHESVPANAMRDC